MTIGSQDGRFALARYTRTAMLLHWLVAALILVNFALAWSVDYLPKDLQRPWIDTHKSVGITVLGLVLLRLLWRAAHAPPALPVAYARWERIAAHIAHAALYVIILALPISGWLHDSAWKDASKHPMYLFGILPWPRIAPVMNLDPATKEILHDRFGALHTYCGYVLIALFVLHVGAALKHQFLERQPEIQRMWPGE